MSLSSLTKEVYNQISRHPSNSIAGSNFRSLSNIPHCWPIIQPGPYLSSSVVVPPLRPTKDHWLGKLLNYQLPNLQQIYLLAIILKIIFNFSINVTNLKLVYFKKL